MKENFYKEYDPETAAKKAAKNRFWKAVSEYKNKEKNEKKRKLKPELLVYKYNQRISLAELIEIKGKKKFLQIKFKGSNPKPVISSLIDLGEHVLKPNGIIPFISYAFKDNNELNLYVKLAKKETLDTLFFKTLSLCRQLIVTTDKETLILIATDIMYSYFVDLFPTTHYDLIKGPPGSGKGAILGVFKLLGYRTVLASNLSGPNMLEILGSSESCQVTIVEDEFSNIEKDDFKRNAIKTGIDLNGQVFRTLDGNTSSRHNRCYYSYCLKILAAENPPQSRDLEGFMDRTFQLESIKGRPKFLVKTVLNEMQKSPELRHPKYVDIISKIIHLRKLLIVYRLLHHPDRIDEVNLNIDGRSLELTSPQIYLFNSEMAPEKKALKEILPALSKFLRKKGELSKKTLEGVVYEALCELFSEIKSKSIIDLNGQNRILHTISHEILIHKITVLANGIPSTIPNEQAFYSTDYGKVTHKHILRICKNRFFGAPDSIGVGNDKERALTFDKEIVNKVGKTFEVINEIEILTEPPNDHDMMNEAEAYDDAWEDYNSDINRGTMGRKYVNTRDKKNNKNDVTKGKPASEVDKISRVLSSNNIEQNIVGIKEIEKTEHVKLQVDELARKDNSPDSLNRSNFRPIVPKASYSYQYSCYFCIRAGKKLETNDEAEYLKHMGLKHLNKPAFPTRTELQKHDLKPQGKPWEI